MHLGCLERFQSPRKDNEHRKLTSLPIYLSLGYEQFYAYSTTAEREAVDFIEISHLISTTHQELVSSFINSASRQSSETKQIVRKANGCDYYTQTYKFMLTDSYVELGSSPT